MGRSVAELTVIRAMKAAFAKVGGGEFARAKIP